MSSSQSFTSRNRDSGQNKIFWTIVLDEKLIECLVELHNQGLYKANGGFKPGYLNAIEKSLLQKLPDYIMKTKPYIESRLKTLKTQFTTIYDMLTGQNSSGFGWDPVNKHIAVETPVWDAYVKSHKEVAHWRHRSFPYYEDLAIVFGKDRVTRKDAETPDDVVLELDNERDQETINETNPLHQHVDATDQQNSNVSSKKRKRTIGVNEYGNSVERVASMLAEEMKNIGSLLSRSITKEEKEEQMRLYNELQRITSLSNDELDVVKILLVDKPARMNVFFGVPDVNKDGLIRSLFKREGALY